MCVAGLVVAEDLKPQLCAAFLAKREGGLEGLLRHFRVVIEPARRSGAVGALIGVSRSSI